MIQLYECPTCTAPTAALAEVVSVADVLGTRSRLMCPACAPISGNRPRYDFQPVMVGGLMLEQADDVPADAIYNVNLVSGVCCADAGDCGHSCGIA